MAPARFIPTDLARAAPAPNGVSFRAERGISLGGGSLAPLGMTPDLRTALSLCRTGTLACPFAVRTGKSACPTQTAPSSGFFTPHSGLRPQPNGVIPSGARNPLGRGVPRSARDDTRFAQCATSLGTSFRGCEKPRGPELRSGRGAQRAPPLAGARCAPLPVPRERPIVSQPLSTQSSVLSPAHGGGASESNQPFDASAPKQRF